MIVLDIYFCIVEVMTNVIFQGRRAKVKIAPNVDGLLLGWHSVFRPPGHWTGL